MELEEDKANKLLTTIRNEMVSIIEEGSEITINKPDFNTEKYTEIKTKNNINTSMEITKPNARNTILDTSNVCNIDGDIQNMQNNLDESCKFFHDIGERLENINFGCLRNRIKDLHLNDRTADSIKTIVDDLKHSFDEKYMENRLNDLTKEVTSKFRNHPGEFGDIPEISEFFRTCSKLEQGLKRLQKQRDDCMYLQKRMSRVAEASYERVQDIQDKIIEDGEGDTTDGNA